eukprot:TRINITY_DN10014_c0_g2_i1.p1 TRINITY_DN10014_c0_g2~~TRINITY_DN10014_c0_g2_i1.p1  ORF type:complete len:246 (-),score=-1.81 TRINITY_DN10014_c0_g2_i1:57-794(-)
MDEFFFASTKEENMPVHQTNTTSVVTSQIVAVIGLTCSFLCLSLNISICVYQMMTGLSQRSFACSASVSTSIASSLVMLCTWFIVGYWVMYGNWIPPNHKPVVYLLAALFITMFAFDWVATYLCGSGVADASNYLWTYLTSAMLNPVALFNLIPALVYPLTLPPQFKSGELSTPQNSSLQQSQPQHQHREAPATGAQNVSSSPSPQQYAQSQSRQLSQSQHSLHYNAPSQGEELAHLICSEDNSV